MHDLFRFANSPKNFNRGSEMGAIISWILVAVTVGTLGFPLFLSITENGIVFENHLNERNGLQEYGLSCLHALRLGAFSTASAWRSPS